MPRNGEPPWTERRRVPLIGSRRLAKLTAKDVRYLLDECRQRGLSERSVRYIHATLRATGWNKSRTATILGIERSTLDRKIRRYELGEARSGADD